MGFFVLDMDLDGCHGWALRMKTLLVEDDASTRELLRALLEARGHEVDACESGESGWERYQRETHPLALLDWLLPGMDGLELCRRMRSLPGGDRTVVIVFTWRDRPEDLQAVLHADADDYLIKPVEVRRLDIRLSIAERLVANRAARERAEARVADMVVELERTRDDLLSILNQIRVATVLTDETGRVSFVNEACLRLLGDRAERSLGQLWDHAFALGRSHTEALRAMCERRVSERARVRAHFDGAKGRRYWVEIEVRDDPRDARRKMFFLYDVSEMHDLRRLLGASGQFADLVGRSAPMLRVYQQIQEVAKVDATVLIEGETGTGKELVARAIHSCSHRKNKPFIAVNLAGLTDSLLGSQLFGHRRGAFTGAIADHKGFFESAAGGTIFLDEVADIPPTVQSSLLRVLQEREIVRLGESHPHQIDVRAVAATQRDLNEEVAQGRFRADLLYRIRVARIWLPPLCQRREDIPLLVAAFMAQQRAAAGKPVEEVSQEAMRVLLDYPWPGNVRELKSAIQFAAIRCKGTVVDVGDLPPELTGAPSLLAVAARRSVDASGAAEEAERQRLVAALERARGNRTVAARLIGVSRTTFYRRLVELNIVAGKSLRRRATLRHLTQ